MSDDLEAIVHHGVVPMREGDNKSLPHTLAIALKLNAKTMLEAEAIVSEFSERFLVLVNEMDDKISAELSEKESLRVFEDAVAIAKQNGFRQSPAEPEFLL